eukprot:maker-scaffold462_size163801-snap-gene-0.47 protein:Tk04573 transcript:maker-scaffold462_size163801-snap-gene-0.47-mRNA-1 annotation:"2 -cyclic-nucleotide 3 -phosphodiesterase-like"
MARTRAELSELAKIISERKFARKQADLSARLVQAREIRDPPESPLPIGMLTDCSSASLNLASPRQCSMDNVSHSAGGGSFWDEDGGGSLFPRIRSSSMSPAVDSGVITPQLEILTHLQAQQHVILLRNHIRQLKARFNRSFDQLHDKKSQMMTDIMKWCQELEQVTGENGFHEEGTVKSSLHWSLREHPESAFETVDPQESVNSLNAKGPNRSDRGGSFDVAKDICPPEFQAKTKSVAFTPAQQSQVEEFCEQLIARNRHEKGETRNQSNTRILLSRRIEDSIGTYECSLKQLYEDKLQVQKQVHTEELKILLHVRRMAEMERWSSQETEFRQQIANAQMERDGALKQVEMGQLAIADNKTLLAELSDNDKLLEKNFKKSFQGINYNQIEALLAAFRRRPKAGSSIEKTIAIFAKKDTKHPKLISIMGPKEAHDLRSKSIASTLEKMCQMFLGPAATNRGGSASSLAAVQALTLEEMDRASHCPENVSGETWLIVCQLRRKKIASEERIADIVAQLADTEEFVEEGSKWHEQAVQDLQFASSEFEAWRIRRNTEINESEMLLTFHRGQVELMLDAFDPFLTDGALLTDDVITKLNKEIDKSVVSRSRATRDIKEFQRGSKMLQWERDKLLFNLEDLKSKWCDIQQTKLPREGRNAFELLSKKGTTATNELYSSMTDEYARLDQLSQKTGRYLSNKLDQLDHESKVISENASGKSAENEQLILEIKALEEVSLQFTGDREAKKDSESDGKPEATMQVSEQINTAGDSAATTSMIEELKHLQIEDNDSVPSILSQVRSSDFLPHAFLKHNPSIKWIRTHQVIIVMRGLSGSGKSTIVNSIRKVYPTAVICSADHYFTTRDGEYRFDCTRLKEAHKLCQDTTKAAMESEEKLIVIDNTNVQKWEMNLYFKLAHRHNYHVILAETQTPWRLDPVELARRNSHGVGENILRQKVGQFKDVIAVYYALFADSVESQSLLHLSKEILHSCLKSCKELRTSFKRFSSLSDVRAMLDYYTRAACLPGNKNMVHCTMKYCGKEGGSDYVAQEVVKESLGKVFPLRIIGLFLTPRTFGARVMLNTAELKIYDQNDDETTTAVVKKTKKHQPSTPSKRQRDGPNGPGSARGQMRPESNLARQSMSDVDHRFYPIPGCGRRAHITLGTAFQVAPVTTGWDLLDLVQQEKDCFEGGTSVPTFTMDSGVLRQYDNDVWAFYLDDSIHLEALFTGGY